MAMKQSLLLVVAAALAGVGCQSAAAPAPPAPPAVRVLSSNGVRSAVEAMKPDLERAVGHPLSIEFSTSAAFKTRIEGGEAFDVAILTPALIDDLVKQGKVAGDSRTDIGRVGVGVGAKAGAPKADVSTPEALKKTLLNAKSVSFTAEGASRPIMDQAFERLGITAAMTPKYVPKGPGEGPGAVAAGEAELVVTLASEIAPVPGVQLLGMFPPEVQGYISFAAGRSANAKNPEAATAFLRQLSEPAVRTALKANLIEPAPADDPALAAADRGFAEAVAKGDTDAAVGMLDEDATWTDASGRTLKKADASRGLPRPAIVDETTAKVRRFAYGKVGVVQIDQDKVHELHVWVQRPAGWRLLVHQEIRSLDAPPTVTPGTGKVCENPCHTLPYEPKSDSERGVVAAYQELETASHASDAKNWGTHVADEFVVVSSNSDKVLDKQTRVAGLARGTFGGVAPTALVSAQMFDFGDVVVMRSRHRPDRGQPLQITRVWVKRDGVWATTLSYQTSIRATGT
jgi:molybdate transport system substrate-binding protein